MRKLIGITTAVSGVLLMVVPRYVLPACEYRGFSRMHCSDTAAAEFIAGAVFLALGVTTLFLKSKRMVLWAGLLALAISVAAFVLPDVYGYCRSSRMPCNYGMVPGIRFVAVASGITVAAGLVAGIMRSLRKKGSA